MHTLIPAFRRQRQEDLSEFKASPVYWVSSRTTRAISQRKSARKTKKYFFIVCVNTKCRAEVKGRSTYGNQFSFSVVWTPGLKLRMFSLTPRAFSYRAISLVPNPNYSIRCVVISTLDYSHQTVQRCVYWREWLWPRWLNALNYSHQTIQRRVHWHEWLWPRWLKMELIS